MAEVASAFVTLVPSFKGGAAAISREIDQPVATASSSAGRKAGGHLSKGMGGVIAAGASRIFAPLAAATAAIGVVSFFKDSVEQAIDLGEAGNKVDVIFGKAGASIVKGFGDKAAKSLGQSNLQALNAASTFGTFGKAAGLSGKALATFSTDFAGLASDMASFYNTSPEDAIEAIGSALRGEAEPIRKYGVLLDDASMRQEALKLGLIKTTKDALTPQQKVLAAQSLIYKQTADAQGDFARTSDGLANKQRILSASFDDIKGKVGEAFIPVLQRVSDWFLNEGLPAIERFGGWLKNNLWPALQEGYKTIMPGIQEALKILGGGLGDSEFSWKKVGDVVTKVVIPVLSNLIRVWLPQVATNVRILIEGVKLLWQGFKTYGHVVSQVVITVLGGFVSLTRGFATMLEGLSKVPGFGWAKDAAAKLNGAADKAERLKNKVAEIDRKVNVDVNISARVTSGRIRVGDEWVNIGLREKGGPVKAGNPYIVGEKRPELFVPDTNGTILPRVPRSTGGTPIGNGQNNITVVVSVDDLAKLNRLDDFLSMLDRARLNGRVAASGKVSA